MISIANHFCIHLLAATFTIEAALSLSTAIQVDLVFPKNGTIYQPVYPFPLVFAISNFSSAGQYKPVVRWILHEYGPMKREKFVVKDGFIGWDKDDSQPNFGAQPDKFLPIDAVDAIGRSNASSWLLEYMIFVGRDRCFGTTADRDLRRSVGEVYFDTSNTTGIMPDAKAFDPCPFNIGVIGITGQNQTDPVCPLLSSPRPAATCAFKVDSQTFDQVSKTMVDTSKCKNVTWPGGTGIGNRCDPNKATAKSESSALRWDSFHTALVFMLLAITISI
jgi:hypothetical protein